MTTGNITSFQSFEVITVGRYTGEDVRIPSHRCERNLVEPIVQGRMASQTRARKTPLNTMTLTVASGWLGADDFTSVLRLSALREGIGMTCARFPPRLATNIKCRLALRHKRSFLVLEVEGTS